MGKCFIIAKTRRDKLEEYSLRQIFRQIVNICGKIETFSVEGLWEWTKFDGIN